MEKNKLKSLAKVLFRTLLSALALYVVFRKIDFQETKRIFIHAHLIWLILGLIAINASQLISSFRLNAFFKSVDLILSWLYNLKLYYVGMFYNLFLPGGIGGDGYKVYLLNKYYKTPVKFLIAAVFLDRLSGIVSLAFLVFILALNLRYPFPGSWIYILLVVLAILIFPVFYLVLKLLFRKFVPVFLKAGIFSIAVQGLQLVSAYCVLRAVGINNQLIEYLVLFMVSSVVAVLPFTIGGVGGRELVFILGSNYFNIDRNTAIAFSLMFFILIAISSFTGIFLESKVQSYITEPPGEKEFQ